jgi:conflict system STAND superfamily ATPase
MIKYNLDRLGWYDFERLVQSLLKEDVGLAVEGWGGRRDFGIDAYYGGELHFPEKQYLSRGPFLFQIKFVENANAAGATPYPVLRDAVAKELRRIEDRVAKDEWEDPAHYVLLTNAVVTGERRTELKEMLRQQLSKAQITVSLGNDVCDRLDCYPELRRSFPQILGLQDLNALFRSAINQSLLNRSSVLQASAVGLLPVFVPTRVYERTWQVLRKHHFVVLEGPPEMGKTAIADVVAVTQLSLGWHALVCQDPDDFFKL